MTSRLGKFTFSIAVALLATGITLAIAQAKTTTNSAVEQSLDCGSCHAETQDAWHGGAHGLASQDSLFVEAWADQGQPGACLVCHVTGYDPATGTWKQDGVSCEACHGPASSDHPVEPMPIQDPAELCGQCHSEARFGWEEWQSSTHYERNMTCTICHDPHSAALKEVEGGEGIGPSALCLNCHRQYSMDFSYSIHKQEGVNCIDCHLRHFGDQADRDIHTMPDHSFTANLDSCNACHAEDMHTGSGESSVSPSSSETPEAELVVSDQLTDKPSQLSPYGYAGLAGMLGLAGGMILSPWLETAYQRMNKKGRK